MVKLRIERKNRIATLYFIQGICIEKRGKIWVADVLLKEVRLRDNTKAVGIKLCARTIESMKKLIIDLAQLYGRTRWNGEKVLTFANILRRYKQKHSKKNFGMLRNVKTDEHILMKQ